MISLLFRDLTDYRQERQIAARYFPTLSSTHEVPYNSQVIFRYSAQPFYKERLRDLTFRNATPINSITQVNYVNDMEWVKDLGELTPKTWFEGEFQDIPYSITTVAKGKIRSVRERWNTDMLCAGSKLERDLLYRKLLDNDSLREQGIVFREYIPLVNYGYAPLNWIPIANEWRFFFYKDQLIDYGYYWISHRQQKKENLPKEALTFALEAARLVGDKANFYTMDIAEKQSGGWTVIELNEGQQSGLCGIDAENFYSNLRKIL